MKEVASLEHVPGTAFLEDSSVQSSIDTTGLKHATGRNAHIVLVPQPSNGIVLLYPSIERLTDRSK